LADESRTQVFYESPHRLKEALDDLRAVYGDTREIAVARELTKLHETIYRGTLAEIVAIADADANLSRGELVLVVAGKPESAEKNGISLHDDSLRKLLAHAPVSVVADTVAALTGLRRNAVYERALQLRREIDAEA
jgi:16S rRNA (cytidine1402-2'-O)-methyltransferase